MSLAGGGSSAELEDVDNCFLRQCPQISASTTAVPYTGVTASLNLAVSLCRNGTVLWRRPPSVSSSTDLAFTLGLQATDGSWSAFKTVQSTRPYAVLASVFGDLLPDATDPSHNACYQLFLAASSVNHVFEPLLFRDSFSLHYLHLGKAPGEYSEAQQQQQQEQQQQEQQKQEQKMPQSTCGGDLAHLGTLSAVDRYRNTGDSFKVSLSYFLLDLSNSSQLSAVIEVRVLMLRSVDVFCAHTGMIVQSNHGNPVSCQVPHVAMPLQDPQLNHTQITIPGIQSSRIYSVMIHINSLLVNITAHINFTSPNLRPRNVALHKSSETEILVKWSLPLDSEIRLTADQLAGLMMKVFWRRQPRRLQGTQLQIVKRQSESGEGAGTFVSPGRISGYDFNSVPLDPDGDGEYSLMIRGLEPDMKYDVIVMGPTMSSQAGLMTEIHTYDPAYSANKIAASDEESAWFKKPLAVVLFAVCGSLILVIIIICCFLALNRRRKERKRERERRRRQLPMPLACIGLGYRHGDDKESWSPWNRASVNGAVTVSKQAHGNGEKKNGKAAGPLQNGTKTTWVYVDKTPRQTPTPDLLSIVDQSESHVTQRPDSNPASSRSATPNGSRPAVRNLRTTGRATTIFRPMYKSTEQLDVPDFAGSRARSKAHKQQPHDATPPEPSTPESNSHRPRTNTMRQSMRKKKAKVMAELQQIGRGKPSSLRHRMRPEDLQESLNTERLTWLAKDELRHEGFKVNTASPFSSGRSTPVKTPPELAMSDEWEIPFEQLYLQDLLLDYDAAVTMKAELVGTETLDETGMPVGRSADCNGSTPHHRDAASSSATSPYNGGGSPTAGGASASGGGSSGGGGGGGGLHRSNSLRKATLTKSKQPVVRSTSLHASSLTRKMVTVKMLKDIACDEDQREFCREIGLLKRVGQHRHLVSLLGCCTVVKPLCIVKEYAPYGDLVTYLRAKRPKKSSTMSLASTSDSGISDARGSVRVRHSSLIHNSHTQISANELMDFVRHIVQAMVYLTSKGVIHRNLTSHTILLGEGHQIKLSDYSLSSLSARNDLAKGDHVKWLSIETLLERSYTMPNDVWSFGVVLWEICTLGEQPYNTIANKQLLDTLQGGYRMRKPDSCSDKLYMLMLHCWSRRPASRPSFKDLAKTFESLLSKTNAEDHIDVTTLTKTTHVPYKQRPSSVSQVPPLPLETAGRSSASLRVTHSQPTTPRSGDTCTFTWLNPSDSDDDDDDDGDSDHHSRYRNYDADTDGNECSTASSSSVFVRSYQGGGSSRQASSGTNSNRSSVHFADEKLPRLIQASSKEEVMRARGASWHNAAPSTAPSSTSSASSSAMTAGATATEGRRSKARPAEKVTIFDQNSSKSLTLQPSSYYLNEMRKYRESGRLPPDATRFSLSPDITTNMLPSGTGISAGSSNTTSAAATTAAAASSGGGNGVARACSRTPPSPGSPPPPPRPPPPLEDDGHHYQTPIPRQLRQQQQQHPANRSSHYSSTNIVRPNSPTEHDRSTPNSYRAESLHDQIV
ncbi:uncharacterized protein LOC135825357 isoform X2 [Sycon ciliatum]|uniref:uncharacterized protein LOC135825357 isoform X2 n=1 Tax=Sycon ciliatum TaxID=27933 RepID=UPI0031F71447